MFKKKDSLPVAEDKVINIEAGMQGDIRFTGPINLRINGSFEGNLEAKGILIIGENARVKADTIKGENVTIAGKVEGNIECSQRLELSASAQVHGDIKVPVLIVSKGAALNGNCRVSLGREENKPKQSRGKKQ